MRGFEQWRHCVLTNGSPFYSIIGVSFVVVEELLLCWDENQKFGLACEAHWFIGGLELCRR